MEFDNNFFNDFFPDSADELEIGLGLPSAPHRQTWPRRRMQHLLVRSTNARSKPLPVCSSECGERRIFTFNPRLLSNAGTLQRASDARHLSCDHLLCLAAWLQSDFSRHRKKALNRQTNAISLRVYRPSVIRACYECFPRTPRGRYMCKQLERKIIVKPCYAKNTVSSLPIKRATATAHCIHAATASPGEGVGWGEGEWGVLSIVRRRNLYRLFGGGTSLGASLRIRLRWAAG